MIDGPGSDTATATEGTIESAALQIRQKMQPQAPDTPAAASEDTPAAESAQDAAPAADDNELPAGDPGNADEADGPEDAGAEPTIAPPAGFTPEEKEWFKTLEPARQEAVLRQLKGTQASESRRQNEHNAAMQALSQEKQQTAQERQQLSSALQQYADPLWRQFQSEFPDIVSGQADPLRVQAENPERFTRYMAYQDQFRRIDATRSQLSQQAQQEEETSVTQFRSAENTRLVELMPELQDKAKFEKFDVDISQYLTGLGIPPERVLRASASELTLANKAMLWDKAQAASKTAQQPKPQGGNAPAVQQQAQRSAPRVLKPGNGGNGATGADEKMAALAKQARRTGAVEDVALSIRAKMERAAAARR